jgi:arsenite/tail-anchored protein-transporting ATPase
MNFFFFTGKGGVGKSTLAAASAWQLSQKYRVLIVSLDPAHNLGDIFGVDIRGERRFSESLHLKEVDFKKQAKAYLKKEIKTLSDSYKYLQTLNLDTYFSVLKYSPGIEEYALLTSIEETIRNGSGFDYIIFDTPPTGLTLRFLALPQVTITWIDRLIQIRQKILEKFYTIRRIKGPQSTAETLLSFDEKDDDILQKLYSLKSGYQSLSRTLQGDACSIALVFNPDLLSLKESLRLIEGLDELHLPLRLLLHNKISPSNREIAERVEAEIGKAAAAPLMRIRLQSDFQKDKTYRLYDLEEDLTPYLERS